MLAEALPGIYEAVPTLEAYWHPLLTGCDGKCHPILSPRLSIHCCADDLSLPTPPRAASPAPASTELDDLQERFAALKRR